MKSVLPTLILAALLSLLAAFAPGSASAGEHGYYGEGYYGEGYYGGGYDSSCCGSCCGRGLLTSPRVYVVPAEPVYVVPARPVYVAPLPVYVAPSRRVYVEDYGYRRRGSVYYEANRYYRPRGYYYGN